LDVFFGFVNFFSGEVLGMDLDEGAFLVVAVFLGLGGSGVLEGEALRLVDGDGSLLVDGDAGFFFGLRDFFFGGLDPFWSRLVLLFGGFLVFFFLGASVLSVFFILSAVLDFFGSASGVIEDSTNMASGPLPRSLYEPSGLA
jgi:hypothetical protein